MPKISQLPSDSSLSLSDFLAGYQIAGSPTTKKVLLSDIQALVLANLLASAFKGNFGDGTFRQLVDDGQSHSSPSGYVYIGKTLIQWASVSVSVTTSATSWQVYWPKAFTTVLAGIQSTLGGNSLARNGDGTFEGLSTTMMNGFMSMTTGSSSVTVYAIAIGT